MLQHSRLRLAGVLAVSLGAGVLAAQTSPEDALTKKARAIHERVLTLDTHNDISPANFTSVCNYTMDLPTQVNLPRMISGGRYLSLAHNGHSQLSDSNTTFTPPVRATVKDFVDHLDYAVKKIGIDHVGISSDFDGGGGVDGWNGADETFNVTLERVRRGYTEEQIAKIWSGNLLRVMDEVQAIAKKGQRAGG